MDTQNVLDFVAGALFFLGFVPYILLIFGWKLSFDRQLPLYRRLWLTSTEPAKPQKVSWMIWIGLDVITLAGMMLKKIANDQPILEGTGQLIGTILGGTFVLVLALKYGKRGWSTLEKCVITGAVVGVILGLLANEPNVTLLINAAVLIGGSIPTFIGAWKDPSGESRLAWTLYWMSCVVALFAVPQWTIEDATQPISFTLIETTMMFILYVKPRIKRRPIGYNIPLGKLIDQVLQRD